MCVSASLAIVGLASKALNLETAVEKCFTVAAWAAAGVEDMSGFGKLGQESLVKRSHVDGSGVLKKSFGIRFVIGLGWVGHQMTLW